MFKFSFRIRHKNCSETALSIKFPKYHITVFDIQSRNRREKQYLYSITGNEKYFDEITAYLKKLKNYKLVKEVERNKESLVLLVILDQKSYIQNIIQKYNSFFIDLHTVYEGYEYWHVGIFDRNLIEPMRKDLKKMGDLEALYIGEVDFAHTLLSEQQKKIFNFAFENGYYEIPRKTTIAKISKALKLNHATAGEHLLKAENKIITSMARKV
ncbi:helix-turn-helix domain-containing protein [Candidatus Woesearchaeota archaeon]|nr:helix-turn-helix domain-containing protein [Candidatus Woesearchaeota archaeon]